MLTARHVVADAKKIVVELFNKKTYKARVLKVDAVWDCAVLELERRAGRRRRRRRSNLASGDAA